MVRDALVDALVGPGGVVMLLVFGQDGAQVRQFRIRVRSGSSRRKVPIRRSQIAFIGGACMARLRAGLKGAQARRSSGTRSALRDDSRADSREWSTPPCCELAAPEERWASITSRTARSERMAFST
jgi:hypothetical protein